MNRKGLVTESIFIVGMIGIFGLMIIVLTYAQNYSVNIFNNTVVGNDTYAMDLMVQANTNYQTSVEGLLMILAGILIVGAALLSFAVPFHPLFIVIGFMGLWPLLIYSDMLRQAYFAITNQTFLNVTALYFPDNNRVMLNLPLIGLVADIIFLSIMFLKGASK